MEEQRGYEQRNLAVYVPTKERFDLYKLLLASRWGVGRVSTDEVINYLLDEIEAPSGLEEVRHAA